MTTWIAPEITYPTWRIGQEAAPNSGPTSVDQRQPGSNAQYPIVASSRVTDVILARGISRRLSGLAKLFAWSRGMDPPGRAAVTHHRPSSR